MELLSIFEPSALNVVSEITSVIEFSGELSDTTLSFDADQYVWVKSAEDESYSGEYTIVPKLHDISLSTAGKWMSQDLTVTQIPTYKTTNTSGGYTVVIAQD